MANRTYYVYLLSNKSGSVLYVGVTNDLQRRVLEHKSGYNPGSFTSRYKVHKLVWWEELPSPEEAIAREKQLKGGSRARKVQLIQAHNPQWLDLSQGWYD
ncbi:GIY-YIG nuclease family protein [Cesiribacter andamanensis]|uniref:GIY-YIG domain-containing protein n=1 Tax=Cesiribacter andamanensis AMV16 TaxID=1279009 RepID=M7NLI4_9BACT|nr:GIY-YIG nuclease family protein [Cesiribacter andamanensis]EMR02645.1 hypothetical protein ADICEAN_02244 [Cesiribacter andamanensis AMV16]